MFSRYYSKEHGRALLPHVTFARRKFAWYLKYSRNNSDLRSSNLYFPRGESPVPRFSFTFLWSRAVESSCTVKSWHPDWSILLSLYTIVVVYWLLVRLQSDSFYESIQKCTYFCFFCFCFWVHLQSCFFDLL